MDGQHTTTRILTVENEEFIRRAMRYALMDAHDLEIVAEATTEDALIQAEIRYPDVALCGIGDGDVVFDMRVPRRLREQLPRVATVILTPEADDNQLFAAAQVGASAYIEKSAIFTDLVRVVREVAHGRYPISDTIQARPRVAARILNTLRYAPVLQSVDGCQSGLSTREKDVLACVAQGHSNKETGHRLGISEQTVKNHLSSIFRKLEIDDRTSAAVYAVKQGLINLDADTVSAPIYPPPLVPDYAAYANY